MPAGGYDGSLTINTKLDNTGFKKGSSELRGAVDSLKGRIDATGKALQHAFKFDFGQPKQITNTFARALKQVNDEINGLGDVGQQALDGDTAALERFKQESGETLAKLEEMKAELDKFGSSSFETPEHAKLSGKYEAAVAEVEKLQVAYEKARDAETELVEKNFSSSSAVENLAGKIKTLERLQTIRDEATREGNTGMANAAEQKAFADYGTSIEAGLKAAQKELDQLWSKFEDSTAYKKAQKEIETFKDKLDQAKTKAADLKNQMDSVPAGFEGYDTTEYEKDKEALEQTIDRLIEYRRLVREGTGSTREPSAEWTAVQEKWQSMTSLSGMLRNAFNAVFSTIASGARTAGAAIGTAISHPLQSLDRLLGGVVVGAGKAVSSLARLAASGIANGLKQIANAASRAAMGLMNMAKNTIVNGLKKVGNALTNLAKGSKKTNVSLSGGFKTMLKYGLGIRSIFVLINKLRAALLSGFSNLAKYDTGFAQTINNFKGSLETLKNSFAAAFLPIAQIVLPILTSLANALSNVMAKVGQLVAALTGQTTFKKAINNQAGVADNSAAAAGALNEESAAAKEAQKTLAGFDDVEILHDGNTSGAGSPGGAGVGAGGFSDMPIDGAMGDLAKRLRDMWANADFTDLGRIIGEKLKAALESIPWDKIKDVLRRVAKSIATLLNGFLEVPGLFETIGRTIAEALNSAFEFVHAFVTNFHWDSLGEAIRDLLNGALTNIDWSLIYDTFTRLGEGIGMALERALDNPNLWNNVFGAAARGLNSIVAGINSFLTAVNWGSIAQNIGFGLNNGMDLIDWKMIADTLTNAINALFDTVYYFFTTVDFFRFGAYVGETLSDVINGVDWRTGGASVAAVVNSLLDALYGFVSTTDWDSVGRAVVDAVGGFLGEFNWGTLGNLLSSAAIGLLDALTGAFEEVNWDELPDQITTAIGDFLDGFDWDAMAESAGKLIGAAFKAIIAVGSELWEDLKGVGNDIMEGGFEGIIDALKDIGTWIQEHIFDPFMDGFKSIFGIASPSTVMEEQGGFIIEGLLNGITSAFSEIAKWVEENIFSPFMSGLTTAFDIVGSVANAVIDIGGSIIGGLKDGITGAVEGISEWLSTHVFEPMSSGLDSAFSIVGGVANGLIEKGKALIHGITSGVEDEESTTELKSGISTQVENIKSTVTDADWKDTGSVIPNDLYKGINVAWKVLTVLFKLGWSTIQLAAKNAGWAGTGSSMVDKLHSGMSNGMKAVTTLFSTTWTTIKTNTTNAGWAALGTTATSSLKTGISTGLNAIKALYSSTWTTIKSNATNAGWSALGNTITSSLKSGISAQLSSIKTIMSNTFNDARASIADIDWDGTGSNIVDSIGNGLSRGAYALTSAANDLARELMYAFDYFNWDSIGSNICDGIYRGLQWGWNWLTTTAWNMAVDIYNSACWALGIASPSKKFNWIAEMMVEGMANGLTENESTAISAVESLADAVTKEAEGASPVMPIDTAVSGIDEVLASFSDKVVSSFESMINAMDQIVGNAALTIPAAASGTMVPYSAKKSATQGGTESEITQLANAIAARSSDHITRRDLMEVLVAVCRDYMNFDFYLGDEQIARHANAGNARLEQRFKMA